MVDKRTIHEVAFLVWDEATRKIDNLVAKMRLGSHLDAKRGLIFQGDIEAAWDDLKAKYPEKVVGKALVGVLAAEIAGMNPGRISWVEQVTPEVERGRFV